VLEEVATPERRTIEEVSAFLGLPPSALVKTLVLVAGDELVVALVRGDQQLHEGKLIRFLRAGELRPAHLEEVRALTGAEVGFVGPVGLRARVVADLSLAPDGPGGDRAYVAGANKDHTHLRGVVFGRDVEPEYADIREAQEGEGCPECGDPLRIEQVIEVGNIFKLGTKYSVPLKAAVLDEDGRERPLVMGSYGIGPARIMASAIEQRHDERGMLWPKAIAPFDVQVVQVQAKDETQSALAASLCASLEQEGWSCLWDDRDERAGVKFADADLLGCPVRVTVGRGAAAGKVEMQARAGGEKEEVVSGEAANRVRYLWDEAD